MDSKENNEKTFTIDDFYDKIQKKTLFWNEQHNLQYIASRSTDENLNIIGIICSQIKDICYAYYSPIEGIPLQKTESAVDIYKYFICNTSFASQLLLTDDRANGHLVDIQPPYSPYLFIEILWNIGFEDILAESILYFPLDLCVDILEILPRCIDFLDFDRSYKFLTTLIPNAYKKLIVIKDTGSQTQEIVQNSQRLTGILQELILTFTNERFLKFEDIPKEDQFKRYGILLKAIIKMVKSCLISKFKEIKLECETKKMYNLTFGWLHLKKLNNTEFQEFLTEIDRELTSLLLKKVKEIDCNIYLNWIEYYDEENTSVTLQRAINLECHFFIENTQNFDYSNIQEYNHLIECLGQIAKKPNTKDNLENVQQVDLLYGMSQGKVDCLISLFQTNKEWDTSVLTKDVCVDLIDHFAEKFGCEQVQSSLETLQKNFLLFTKRLVHLNITELYEVTIKCILKFSENEKIQNIVNIKSIETFIIHNPNFSTLKNLKVILFFLCLKTNSTLKILLKMVIGHSDYENVAVSLDDLMLLLPILKIRTSSKYESIMEVLSKKFENKKESYQQWCTSYTKKQQIKDKPNTVALIVLILQEICLEDPQWNIKKFASLMPMLYSFCIVSEIVKEIFTPLLLTFTSSTCLKCTLVELYKLIGIHDFKTTTDLAYAFQELTSYLLRSSHISKYLIDELMTLILEVNHSFSEIYENNEFSYFNHYMVLLSLNDSDSNKFNLLSIVGTFMHLVQNKCFSFNDDYPISLFNDNVLSYLFLKSTKKQYIQYANEIVTSYGNYFNWTSKSAIYDNIIRLTFETCFLCLEFPKVCSSDNISFLINCLIRLLDKVRLSKEDNKLHQKLCKNLNTQILIFKNSIKSTSIADSYTKLLEEFEKSHLNLEMYLAALKRFTFSCTKESEKLKTFNGLHSIIAIKLWLGNQIINMSVNTTEIIDNEKCIQNVSEFFKQI